MGWASVPERYDGGDAGRNQENLLRLQDEPGAGTGQWPVCIP